MVISIFYTLVICVYEQSDLKGQELRNERLSVKLQQRPEADDLRAMQQQLSSLHLVMEQSSSEHEREMERMRASAKTLEEEKNKVEDEMEALKKKIESSPSAESLKK